MLEKHEFDMLSDELISQRCAAGGRLGIYYTTYPAGAFKSADSEESIRLTRAEKRGGEDCLNFWIAAEWAEGWHGREEYFPNYIRGAACEPILEKEFNGMVQTQSSGLIAPLSLPIHARSGFLSARLMYSTKTDFIVSIVAEYEDELLHFLWQTTS